MPVGLYEVVVVSVPPQYVKEVWLLPVSLYEGGKASVPVSLYKEVWSLPASHEGCALSTPLFM